MGDTRAGAQTSAGSDSRRLSDRTRLSRRAMLGSLAAGGAGLAAACGPPPSGPWIPSPPVQGPFLAGVSSGDPRPTSTTLWTQAVPSAGAGPVDLSWVVAADDGLTDVAATGSVTVTSAQDHTAHVSVEDLDPDRHWYYRFSAGSEHSPIGQARTAPAPGAPAQRLRLAFMSCQMFSEGYFTAYRHVLDEDVDLMLHLGDYIYEYGSDSSEYGYHRLRTDPVDQPRSVEGYRAKYQLYRTDADLRAAHQQIPMVSMWDDHEVYDDYDRHGDPARRAAAYQAWFEHMPHLPDPADPTRIYRSLSWGDLADLVLIDLAQYRDTEAPAPFLSTDPKGAVAHAQGRTLLGDAQREWVRSTMADSTSTWRILGNPQMLQPLRLVDLDTELTRFLDPDLPTNAGLYLNGTQWDGYQTERRQLLESLADAGVVDNIVLTGDIHSWWVGEVPLDIDDPSTVKVAAEFAGGSITAPSFEQMLNARVPELNPLVRDLAGDLEYVNLFDHGYGICEITPEGVEVTFRRVDILDPGAGVETMARFRVARGSTTITRTA